jgi:branched-chain amino acid transport system ATP-binding protein
MTSGATLSVRDVTVRFGGVVANQDVSLTAAPGQITALIGPNGAGKTTFINAVTGFVRSQGQVMIEDTDISGLAAHVRRRLGLARTWQAGELFEALSILDNVRVAEEKTGVAWLARDLLPRSGRAAEKALALLDRFGLADDAGMYPSQLSLGQQRLVGVARALAGEPRVLLLDEPAAGLDTNESITLGQQLQAIASEGATILLVDHDMNLVFSVAHQVYVLDFGQVIASGPPQVVQKDARVIEAYLGGPVLEEEDA